jgi:type II secretory pathway component HofQ
VIGGLLNEEHTTTTTKVPFFGDVPWLGALFRHQSSSTTKRDLVIEVTPHLMPEPVR